MMKNVALMIFFGVAVSLVAAEAQSRKPWLGMALILRQAPDGTKFLYAGAVAEGTPAAKAGMAAGDVITAINDRKIAFRDDLDVMEFIGASKPGEMIRFRVVRAGKSSVIAVKVGELPREYEAAAQQSLERARELRKKSGETKRK